MELFDFQRETVERFKEIKGTLIAHDMGLGKTVTAIALDVERRKRFDHRAVTLIICPLAMISSWVKHFNEWAPHLKVFGIDNKRRAPFMEAVDNTFRNDKQIGYDVFIIHYPAVRLEPNLAKYPWFHIVCDEVHALQDRNSSQSKMVKKLQAFYKTGMSGTPVFNKPDDLWSILNWLYPKYWRSYWSYFKRYIKWVEWNGYRTVIGVENEEELQGLIKSFYSRIMKEEVLTDLPDKYYSTIKTKMHKQQEKAYKQMKKDMLAWVGEHEHEPVNAPAIIAQLIRLQQFASAYAEVEYFEDQYGDRKTKIRLTDPSNKIDAVMEILSQTNEQIVVFSTFAQMAELLAKRCEKAGISCGLYTGSVPKADRDKIVEDFQEGKLRVFAGSIKAGGVGLTLTAASTVIIMNREWAESLNEQAIDRLHRIGQKNAVHVIDIISDDTIDLERNLGIAMNWAVVKQLLGENNDDK